MTSSYTIEHVKDTANRPPRCLGVYLDVIGEVEEILNYQEPPPEIDLTPVRRIDMEL